MNPRLKAFGQAFKENPALGIAFVIVLLAVFYYIYKKNSGTAPTTNQGNTTSNPPIAEIYAFDVTPPGPTSTSPAPPTTSPQPPVLYKPPIGVTRPIPVQNQPSRTVTVGKWPAWNSTLWGISEHYYGAGNDYMKIYNANKGTIGNNPSLLHPGEVLTIP